MCQRKMSRSSKLISRLHDYQPCDPVDLKGFADLLNWGSQDPESLIHGQHPQICVYYERKTCFFLIGILGVGEAAMQWRCLVLVGVRGAGVGEPGWGVTMYKGLDKSVQISLDSIRLCRVITLKCNRLNV